MSSICEILGVGLCGADVAAENALELIFISAEQPAEAYFLAAVRNFAVVCYLAYLDSALDILSDLE